MFVEVCSRVITHRHTLLSQNSYLYLSFCIFVIHTIKKSKLLRFPTLIKPTRVTSFWKKDKMSQCISLVTPLSTNSRIYLLSGWKACKNRVKFGILAYIVFQIQAIYYLSTYRRTFQSSQGCFLFQNEDFFLKLLVLVAMTLHLFLRVTNNQTWQTAYHYSYEDEVHSQCKTRVFFSFYYLKHIRRHIFRFQPSHLFLLLHLIQQEWSQRSFLRNVASLNPRPVLQLLFPSFCKSILYWREWFRWNA